MSWILFAVFTALAASGNNITGKVLTKKFDEYKISLINSVVFSVLSIIAILVFYLATSRSPFNEIKPNFWLPSSLSAILSTFAVIFFFKGIKSDNISKSIPFIAFTPIFIIFIEFALYRRLPLTEGAIGIFMIVAGSYIINVNTHKTGFLEPFKTIYRHKGSAFIVMTALIWAVTSVLDKMGTLNSSPLIYTTFVTVSRTPLIFLAYTFFEKNRFTTKELVKDINNKKMIGLFLILATFHLAESLFQMQAIQTGMVSYVIGIKRSSILITVLMGFLFLKEKFHLRILMASLMMVLGVILIIMR